MKKSLIFIAALIATSPAHAQMKRDVGAIFDNADVNADGVITRAEFQQARAARFDKADRNRDGAVGRDDFKRLARLRPGAVERLNALISEADVNGDGRVTRDEMANAPMPMFDRADTNQDGRIDQAEIAAFKAKAAEFRQQR
ncbi:EF-hand domain-containing protein [Sphingomonas sp. QA11]|uniref:EF-hand domain-containing protein n=1 Tax=Sphingomonas sp. QA11 TaxID=2950605 RepID=UPI00234BE1B0|nr:EF-hand domain-containing protein [Sphingomonas sp. QA11]WCM27410.1 EF-hand domain-containing protein [Sphingomonas sp. QA11]